MHILARAVNQVLMKKQNPKFSINLVGVCVILYFSYFI